MPTQQPTIFMNIFHSDTSVFVHFLLRNMTTNTTHDGDGFVESSKTNPINTIFLRENINRFDQRLFQEYTKRLSR